MLPVGIEWLPAILIAASLLPRVALWFRRDFNHDDFAFGWGTWNYARGGGGYTYGFVFLLTEILKPLFLLFPESFVPLDIARLFVLFAYLANIYLVYRLAHLFGGSKAWALAACALAAWQPDLIMRAEDIRTDPFGTTCLLGGALLLLRYGPKAHFERAGFLFGLAVIFDYKFGVAAPFAAAAVVMIARPRFLGPLVRLGAGAAIPVVLYLGRLVLKETWSGFYTGLEQTAVSLKIGGEGQVAVHAAAIFQLSPVTFILAGIGAVGLCLWSAGHRSDDPRPGVYALLVLAFFALFSG